MSACRDCPIPSNRPRLWGSWSASLKKAAICERQLNEANDDLPPAHPNPVMGQKLGQKAGHVMGAPASID
jgi:hypothetical protein